MMNLLYISLFISYACWVPVHCAEDENEDVLVKRAILDNSFDDALQDAVGGGAPGKDFPVLNKVPRSNFNCQGLSPGYYADQQFGCQVFHVCHTGNRKDSFLCPNGTIFHQLKLVCDWWYNVDCSSPVFQKEVSNSISKDSFSDRKSLNRNSKKINIKEQFFTSDEIVNDIGSKSSQFRGDVNSEVESSQFRTNQKVQANLFFSNNNNIAKTTSSRPRVSQNSFQQTNEFKTNHRTVTQKQPFGIALNQVSQPSFKSDNGQQRQITPVKSRNNVRSRTGSNRISNNEKNTLSKKQPIKGIPFPPTLPFSSNSNLFQRTGQVSQAAPSVTTTTTEPPITTISSSTRHFSFPNERLLPPKSVTTSQAFKKNINKSNRGRLTNVKKVKVNRRPIGTANGQQFVSKKTTSTQNHQNKVILDNKTFTNQFFRIGDPVSIAQNSGRGKPLPTVRHNNNRVISNNNDRVHSTIRNLPKVTTPLSTTINNRIQSVNRPTQSVTSRTTSTFTNRFQTSFATSSPTGRPLPSFNNNPVTPSLKSQVFNQQNNARNQVSNRPRNGVTGIPLPSSKLTFPTNNQIVRPQTSAVQSQNTFAASLPASRSRNRGAVTFQSSKLSSNVRNRNRINSQNQRVNSRPFNVNINSNRFDDDRFDDDRFDDDRFDDDRFDDDRFDDDRFDDDRFDDDRFDDDRFDDDRFDDDRFDDDRFDDDRFDDDRFDDDKFDDDRFDDDRFDDDRFDDDDDDDRFDFNDDRFNNFLADDDRLKRFGNSRDFVFGKRRTRGSSFLTQLNKNKQENLPSNVKAPSEIQLPPPPLV